jgi:hypothetical protein
VDAQRKQVMKQYHQATTKTMPISWGIFQGGVEKEVVVQLITVRWPLLQ